MKARARAKTMLQKNETRRKEAQRQIIDALSRREADKKAKEQRVVTQSGKNVLDLQKAGGLWFTTTDIQHNLVKNQRSTRKNNGCTTADNFQKKMSCSKSLRIRHFLSSAYRD